ncbi:MAG: ribonuclease J [Patescibacteria group bacterium]|nr:ribonuclease J [Patescibacteria group bacterium]
MPDKKQKEKQTQQKIDTKAGTLRIIPLGGLGEIGKNMTAYEFRAPNGQTDIIIVDCGFKFPEDEHLGVDYVIPDVQYLEEKKDKIRGMFITHAHEDHVGGLPYIIPKIPTPIFAPQLTAAMIERKLVEFKIEIGAGIRVINPDKDKIQLGSFNIEFFRINHSIPDSVGLAIRTPVGLTLHTGDFKFDYTPEDKRPADFAKLVNYGKEGVLALLSDSTGAEEPGYTLSEQEVEHSFFNIFEDAQGRIIVASFASLINRMQQVVNVAQRTGRKVAFVGRSMLNNVEIAVKYGYLKVPADAVINSNDLNKYPDNKVVIMCTGSQGEPNSALSRISRGEHKQVNLKRGDLVILSSSIIPGNERLIYGMIDDLYREGARVIREGARGPLQGSLHVSGHGGREELKLMMALTQPKFLVPIHGEIHHLAAHGDLAHEAGIPEENIFLLENGQVLELGLNSARLNGKIPVGVLLVDGLGVGDVQTIVLRDRQVMSTDGIFVAIVTVDKKTGKLLSSPDIISRGFIYMRESEKLVQNARMEIRKIVEKAAAKGAPDWNEVKNQMRDDLSKYLYKETQRKPMVVPVTIEL